MAALACKRFKGRHTHKNIATELDQIHSSYGINHKITTTVTDNGSNFVKAFKRYQPVDQEDEDDNEVTFTNVNEALQTTVDDDDAITLPPHMRCASHTLNLVSCTDISGCCQHQQQKHCTETQPQNAQGYGTRPVVQLWPPRLCMTLLPRSF